MKKKSRSPQEKKRTLKFLDFDSSTSQSFCSLQSPLCMSLNTQITHRQQVPQCAIQCVLNAMSLNRPPPASVCPAVCGTVSSTQTCFGNYFINLVDYLKAPRLYKLEIIPLPFGPFTSPAPPLCFPSPFTRDCLFLTFFHAKSASAGASAGGDQFSPSSAFNRLVNGQEWRGDDSIDD